MRDARLLEHLEPRAQLQPPGEERLVLQLRGVVVRGERRRVAVRAVRAAPLAQGGGEDGGRAPVVECRRAVWGVG